MAEIEFGLKGYDLKPGRISHLDDPIRVAACLFRYLVFNNVRQHGSITSKEAHRGITAANKLAREIEHSQGATISFVFKTHDEQEFTFWARHIS